MNEEQEKEFDEMFKDVFGWIKLNCKDEIINGIDIETFDYHIKQHISTLLEEQKKKHQEEIKKIRDEVVGVEAFRLKDRDADSIREGMQDMVNYGWNDKRQEAIDIFKKHIK